MIRVTPTVRTLASIRVTTTSHAFDARALLQTYDSETACSSNEDFWKSHPASGDTTDLLFVTKHDKHVRHVGNNISETYPRRIGQGLNETTCILGSMVSSLTSLSNPTWVSLGNFVSHMAREMHHARQMFPFVTIYTNRSHAMRDGLMYAFGHHRATVR